jgi:chromosomal replication initiation ATPase DnaA
MKMPSSGDFALTRDEILGSREADASGAGRILARHAINGPTSAEQPATDQQGQLAFEEDNLPVSNDLAVPSTVEARVLEANDSPEGLRRGLTFETFVIGESNRFAYAAAAAVAEHPGQAYNPLLIYGPTGHGKTHLLHAIGHAIADRQPDATILCCETQLLLNEYIDAVRHNTRERFMEKYASADVLLIDDIQFWFKPSLEAL